MVRNFPGSPLAKKGMRPQYLLRGTDIEVREWQDPAKLDELLELRILLVVKLVAVTHGAALTISTT